MEEKLDCHFKESMDDRPEMSLKITYFFKLFLPFTST